MVTFWKTTQTLVTLALAITAGLATTQTGNVQSPSRECYYATSHGMMGSDQYTCDHGALVHQSQFADMKGGFRRRTETFRPSPAAWSRFWKSMDAGGVWKWQRYYSPKVEIADGSGWVVELRHAHRTLKSQGYNAAPQKFDLFVRAMELLMEDARKDAWPGNPGDRDRGVTETR